MEVDSLLSGECSMDVKCAIFKCIVVIIFMSISIAIAFR